MNDNNTNKLNITWKTVSSKHFHAELPNKQTACISFVRKGRAIGWKAGLLPVDRPFHIYGKDDFAKNDMSNIKTFAILGKAWKYYDSLSRRMQRNKGGSIK